MSAPDYWLTTDRLGLRRFTSADFDWLVGLYSDPDVMRYLGGVKNRTQADEVFQARILGYYDQHPGLGVWMTIERATGTPVGFHLLNHIRGEQIVQVGFTLLTKIGLIRNGERAFPHPDYASAGAMAWFERDAPAWIEEHVSGPLTDRPGRAG